MSVHLVGRSPLLLSVPFLLSSLPVLRVVGRTLPTPLRSGTGREVTEEPTGPDKERKSG